MTIQAEISAVERKAYRQGGMIYVIHGDQLYQVDEDYFLSFKPGNQFYGSKMKELKKLQPLPHSELVAILERLENRIAVLKK